MVVDNRAQKRPGSALRGPARRGGAAAAVAVTAPPPPPLLYDSVSPVGAAACLRRAGAVGGFLEVCRGVA